MKNRKTKKFLLKWISAGLSLCLLTGSAMLAGCGSPSSNGGRLENGKIPITFWYSAGKTASGVMEEIIDAFNESQDNWEVTGIQQADYVETYTKLQAAIAGGKAPDLALLTPDKSGNLSKKDLLVPLNSFLDGDTDFPREDYIDVFWNQGVQDGDNVFAIPFYGTTQVMYYNRAAWESAGLNPDAISTWQDLADACAVLKETRSQGSDTFFGWEPMWGADNLVDIALSNGGSMVSEDGKTVLISSDAWVESWDAVRSWIHEEKIMRIHHGGQGWQYWYETMDDVLNDKAGGYTGSSGDQADLDFSKVGAMEQPGFGENPSFPVANALQVVMVKGKNTEQNSQGAYEFMKFISTPEIQAKWAMSTGYIPVREATMDNSEYKAYTDENPHALVPLSQSLHASVKPLDPTGGKIYDALKIAADKVEIENISAKEALEEAAKTAQKALDSIN